MKNFKCINGDYNNICKLYTGKGIPSSNDVGAILIDLSWCTQPEYMGKFKIRRTMSMRRCKNNRSSSRSIVQKGFRFSLKYICEKGSLSGD